jgi:MmyB-like transcription regulator ligand binding domain
MNDKANLIHPVVGQLVLQAKTFDVADHPDLRMVIYTPVLGTDTSAKLAGLSESFSAE